MTTKIYVIPPDERLTHQIQMSRSDIRNLTSDLFNTDNISIGEHAELLELKYDMIDSLRIINARIEEVEND